MHDMTGVQAVAEKGCRRLFLKRDDTVDATGANDLWSAGETALRTGTVHCEAMDRSPWQLANSHMPSP